MLFVVESNRGSLKVRCHVVREHLTVNDTIAPNVPLLVPWLWLKELASSVVPGDANVKWGSSRDTVTSALMA